MSLYQIDRADFLPATTLAIYRVAVRWAAARGTAFELLIEPAMYDDPQRTEPFRGLGLETTADDAVRVRGVPDQRFVQALTSARAPPRARAGDESPVEQIIIRAGERDLYVCYDYGTVQIVDVDATELRDLQRAFQDAGLPPVRMFPVPRR
jgi:hypothetical protein